MVKGGVRGGLRTWEEKLADIAEPRYFRSGKKRKIEYTDWTRIERDGDLFAQNFLDSKRSAPNNRRNSRFTGSDRIRKAESLRLLKV